MIVCPGGHCPHNTSEMRKGSLPAPSASIAAAIPQDGFEASKYVDANEVKDLFLELVQIPGKSLHERKVADVITKKITDMGYSVKEDEAGKKIGGNAGNLIVNVPGTVPDAPPLIFLAHMDTVPLAVGVKPKIDKDGVIHSNGFTALGGDDRSGDAELLTVMKSLKDNALPHPPLQFIFTVAEEKGLWGSKALDPKDVHGKMGFEADFFHPNEILWGTEWGPNGPVGGPPHPNNPAEHFLEDFTCQSIRDIGMNPQKFEMDDASSDSATLRQMGIPALIIGAGEQDVHTVKEHISIKDMAKATELMMNIIHNANAFVVNDQDQIVPRQAA